MAAESNTPGFHHEEAFGSAMNRHAISFQTGAMNSTSEMIPMGNYFGGMNTTGGGGGGGMLFSPGNSSNNHHPVLTQPLASSLLLDSVHGLKHDTGLAVEWSVEEQYILDEGLKKSGTSSFFLYIIWFLSYTIIHDRNRSSKQVYYHLLVQSIFSTIVLGLISWPC